MKHKSRYYQARKSSTPIIAIETFDCLAAIEWMAEVETDLAQEAGTEDSERWCARWDLNDGVASLSAAYKAVEGSGTQGDPVAAVYTLTEDETEDAVLFMVNADMFLDQYFKDRMEFVNAIYMSRDIAKGFGAALVLVGHDFSQLPAQLSGSVVIIEEPLPTQNELETVVDSLCDEVTFEVAREERSKAVDALIGLPYFPAEQSVAMSLAGGRLDLEELWHNKRVMVRQTPGVEIYEGNESYDKIGGRDAIKEFMMDIMNGNNSPRGIVFIDEIEKAITGEEDSVSADSLGVMLKEMQNTNAIGVIFIGAPGSAKSEVAKATGNSAGVPTIEFDIQATRDKYVGESGRQLRQAFKVIDAVTQGKALYIATSNNISAIPSALVRRFTLGTYYYDLPSASEREQIWQILGGRYEVDVTERPNDEGWTGGEIRRCCDIAYRRNRPVKEVGDTQIVPYCKSHAENLQMLRQMAVRDGYLCAQTGKPFDRDDVEYTSTKVAKSGSARKTRHAKG